MINQEEIRSLAIMRQCRRFDRCSVPICPLDLLQDYRTKLPGEPSCRLPKSERVRIGKDTALRYEGMTRAEWAATKHWQRLSEEEKARKRAIARQFLPKIKASTRGLPSTKEKPLPHKEER